jgi:hypothetical protein
LECAVLAQFFCAVLATSYETPCTNCTNKISPAIWRWQPSAFLATVTGASRLSAELQKPLFNSAEFFLALFFSDRMALNKSWKLFAFAS